MIVDEAAICFAFMRFNIAIHGIEYSVNQIHNLHKPCSDWAIEYEKKEISNHIREMENTLAQLKKDLEI